MAEEPSPNVEIEHAQAVVDRFARRFGEFGEAHRLLARYAALPLVLTPELVNYLRNSFLRGQTPWVAEVDLLLSDLCRPVGYEQYAMHTAVRAVLLAELQSKVGRAMLEKVARLLVQYVRQLYRTAPVARQRELQAQQWAAMVYLEEGREQAVREIAQSMRNTLTRTLGSDYGHGLVDQAELARLTSLTKILASELATYPQLVEYAAQVGQLLEGTAQSAPADLAAYHQPAQVLDIELPAFAALMKPDKRRNKKALLVGINQYSQAPLLGCINDTRAIERVLLEYFDFEEQNIMSLYDSAATRQGMLDGLAWLLDDAQAGDVRVFQFSGHGSQLPDTTGKAPDGKDYLMATYDYEKNPLRGSDLQPLFAQVSDGVNLTLIVDGSNDGGLSWALSGRHFFLAACAENQFASDTTVEGDPYGLFTHALCQAIQEAKGNLTYQAVLNYTRASLKAKNGTQIPQLFAPAHLNKHRLLASLPTRKAPRKKSVPAHNKAKKLALSVPTIENAYGLIIGISHYQNFGALPDTVLLDVVALHDVLVDSQLGGYKPQNVQILAQFGTPDTDPNMPNKRAILDALHNLAARTEPEATVLIYFSGLAGRLVLESKEIEVQLPTQGQSYLLPLDVTRTEFDQTAISGEEFLNMLHTIRSRKVVLIFDNAQGNDATAGNQGFEIEIANKFDSLKAKSLFYPGIPEEFYRLLAERAGWTVIASARQNERPVSLSNAAHSLFMQHLLGALRGGVASKDGYIRIFDLFEYLQPNVTIDSSSSQHPIFKASLEENYPIALYLGGKQEITTENYHYDAFIDYSQRDTAWVWEQLLPRLEQAGVNLATEQNLEPGRVTFTNLAHIISQSRYVLIVVTPEWLQSDWAEIESVLNSIPGVFENFRVLPLLLRPCQLPLRLEMLIHLDFTDLADPETLEINFQRLIHQLQTAHPLTTVTKSDLKRMEQEYTHRSKPS